VSTEREFARLRGNKKKKKDRDKEKEKEKGEVKE
jgi:hypothetical protein